jgi:hypothetical protein
VKIIIGRYQNRKQRNIALTKETFAKTLAKNAAHECKLQGISRVIMGLTELKMQPTIHVQR